MILIKKPFRLNLNNLSQVRFILMVLIVILHSYSINNSSTITANFIVQEYCSQVLARVAVPVYFYISGYLFYKNLDSIKTWKTKIYSRLKTLILPYFIWNIGYGILLLIIPTSMIYFKNISYDFDGFLQVLSNIFVTPAINPLWFIRDLFIFQIFTLPLIYLKRTHVYIIVLAITLFFIQGYRLPFTFLSSEGLLFFILGIAKILPGYRFLINRKIGGLTILFASIFNLINHIYTPEYYFIIHRILTSILAIAFIFMYLNESFTLTENIFGKVKNYTFYIFVLHFPIIQLLLKIYDFNGIFGYIIVIIISFSMSIIAGNFINKLSPLASVLTGNRK